MHFKLYFRAAGRKQIFPLVGADDEDSFQIDIIGHRDGYRRNTQVFAASGGVEALSTCQGGGREHHTAIPMCIGGIENGNAKFGAQFAQNNRVYDGTQVATTLTSQMSGHVNNYGIPMFGIDYTVAGQEREISNAVTARTTQDRHGVAIKGDISVPVIWYDKYKCYIAIRKLTPRECFRLQGWEDKYFERAQFVNSDSQLYKQAGNGVTVAVVEDIARAIGNAR